MSFSKKLSKQNVFPFSFKNSKKVRKKKSVLSKEYFYHIGKCFQKKCFVLFFQKNPKKCVQIKCVSKKDIFTTLEFLSKEIVSFQKMCLSKFSFQKKKKKGVNIVNLFICCNLKLFLRLMF